MDAQEVKAIACSTSETSAQECSAVLAALEKDVRPIEPTLSTSSLRPLTAQPTQSATSGDADLCRAGINAALGAGRAAQPRRWIRTPWTTCNASSDEYGTEAKLAAGNCWVFAGRSDGSMGIGTASGDKYNLAKVCCDSFPSGPITGLIVNRVALICVR
jgi:hypothetical protein